MPTDAPTWEDTTEAAPTWDDTSEPTKGVAVTPALQQQMSADWWRLPQSNIGPFRGSPLGPTQEQRQEARDIFASLQEPAVRIPRIQGRSTLGRLAAAPVNVASGFLEGIESPVGAALLPLFDTPAGPILKGYFAERMGEEGGRALSEAWKENDIQKAAEGILGVGTGALLARDIFPRAVKPGPVQGPPAMGSMLRGPEGAPAPRFELPPGPETVDPTTAAANALRMTQEATGEPFVPASQLRVPRPVVPESAPEAPAKPLTKWQDFVAHLRENGTGEETLDQVKAMFKEQLPNMDDAQAAALAKNAFGPKWASFGVKFTPEKTEPVPFRAEKGKTDATKEGQQPGDIPPERGGDDEGGAPAGPKPSGGVPPATPVAGGEAPSQTQAPPVDFTKVKSGSDFANLPADKFDAWKKAIGYGNDARLSISKGWTEDDVLRAQEARNKTLEEQAAKMAEMAKAPKEPGVDKDGNPIKSQEQLFNEFGQIQLKAQTLKELIDGAHEQKQPPAPQTLPKAGEDLVDVPPSKTAAPEVTRKRIVGLLEQLEKEDPRTGRTTLNDDLTEEDLHALSKEMAQTLGTDWADMLDMDHSTMIKTLRKALGDIEEAKAKGKTISGMPLQSEQMPNAGLALARKAFREHQAGKLGSDELVSAVLDADDVHGGVPQKVKDAGEAFLDSMGDEEVEPQAKQKFLAALADATKEKAPEEPKPVEPEPMGRGGKYKQSDTSQEAKLWSALHNVEGAEERWDKLRQKGATDAEIEKLIGQEFGIQGGSSLHGGYAHKGGAKPKLWNNLAWSGKPDLTGKALVTKARELLQIPQPAAEPVVAEGLTLTEIKRRLPVGYDPDSVRIENGHIIARSKPNYGGKLNKISLKKAEAQEIPEPAPAAPAAEPPKAPETPAPSTEVAPSKPKDVHGKEFTDISPTTPEIEALKKKRDEMAAKIEATKDLKRAQNSRFNDMVAARAPLKEREAVMSEMNALDKSIEDQGKELGKVLDEIGDKRMQAAFAPFRAPGYKSPEGATPVSSKQLKEQRANLLAQAKDALKKAPEEHGDKKITLSVPGDGEFQIFNNKESLKKFVGIVESQFPESIAKPRGPTLGGREGKPMPKAEMVKPEKGKTMGEALGKVAGNFVSEAPDREPIQTAFADGTQIVATDGRSLIRIVTDQAPGSVEKPVRLTASGKETEVESQYPNWKLFLNKDYKLAKGGQDSGELWQMANQAIALTKGTDKVPQVELLVNPDGSLGARSKEVEIGSYEHNVQKGAKSIGNYNAGYIFKMVDAARRLGNDKVDLSFDGEEGALKIRGKNMDSLVMPMKLEGQHARQTKKLNPTGEAVHGELPPVDPPSKLQDKLDDVAAQALKRIRAREGGTTFGSGPLHELPNIRDYAIYGASKLLKYGARSAEWTKDMLEAFGGRIKPHLDKIYEAAKDYLDRYKAEQAPGKQTSVQEIIAAATGVDRSASPSGVTRAMDVLQSGLQTARALKEHFTGGQKIPKDQVKLADDFLEADANRIRESLTDLVKNNLPPEERGRFVTAIANATKRVSILGGDPETMYKAAARVAARIEDRASEWRKENSIDFLKQTVKRAIQSPAVDIGYKRRIMDLLSKISFTKPQPETLAALQKTKDYLDRQAAAGVDVDMPREVLDNLELLTKVPIKDIPAEAVHALAQKIAELEQMGRLKVQARQEVWNNEKNRKLGDLSQEETRPLNDRPTYLHQPGESDRASVMVQNALNRALNVASMVDKALMPIDALFDMLGDGKGDYRGWLFRNVRGPIDLAFNQHLVLRDELAKPIEDLIKKHNMGQAEAERINVYGLAHMEGGLERMIENGVDPDHIAKILKEITDPEREVYQAMRKAFDSQLPDLQRMMHQLYNIEVKPVENYWPMPRDWESTKRMMPPKAAKEPVFGEPMAYDELAGWKDMLADFVPGRTSKTEQGMTIERVPDAKTPIRMNSFDVFWQHINDVTYLLKTQRDLKMIGEMARTDQFSQKYGHEGQGLVLDWLDTVARQGRLGGIRRFPLLDKLRTNTSAGIIGFRVASQFVHASNLAFSMQRAGIENYRAALTEIATKPGAREWVEQNFREALARGGGEPAIAEAAGKSPIAMTSYRKVARTSMAIARAIDKYNSEATMLGVYFKELRRKGGDPSRFMDEPIDREAQARAMVLARRAVASPLPKDVPMAISRGQLTGGNISLGRSLMQFQNIFLDQWSNMRHDLWHAGFVERNPKKIAGMTIAIMGALAAETLIREGVRSGWQQVTGTPNKKKEEGIPSKLVRETARRFPFGGQLTNLILHDETGIPPIDLTRETFRAGKTLATTKNPRTAQRAGVQLLGGIGQIAGIPGSGEISTQVLNAMKASQ